MFKQFYQKFIQTAQIWAMRTIKKPEEIEQYKFVKWLYDNNYIFSAIPNSTHTKSRMQTARNTLMGLNAGLPDLFILLKNGWILFLEMKKSRGKKWGLNGSKISENQKFWIEKLQKIDNVESHIAHGFAEAVEIVEQCEKL